MPKIPIQGMTTSDVRFTFSVGDTTRAVYNWYWARQTELVTINTIFSVVHKEVLCTHVNYGAHGGPH